MTIGRDTQISQLNSSSSFYDWFLKENDEIIAKLNLMNTFTVEGTNGITAPVDTNGKASIGLSGKVDLGISFNGPAYFNDFAAIPNVAVKVPQINSTVGGFTFGTPVRVYWDVDTNTVKYEPARGNDPDQAEVMGVVSQITATHSYVTLLGKIDGDFSAVNSRGIGLTAGWIYFTDPGITGTITDIEPTATGHVSKPIIMGLTGNSGLVLQMRGNYLSPVTVSAGLTGSTNIILQCDADITSKVPVGSFVSIYKLSNVLKNQFFQNKNVPFARIMNIGNTDNLKYYLTPAICTVSDGYLNADGERLTPYDSNYVIGMIEKVKTDGVFWYYTIITSGYTTTIPSKFFNASSSSVTYDDSASSNIFYFNPFYVPSDAINVSNPQIIATLNADPLISNHIAFINYGKNFLIVNKHDSSGSPFFTPALRSTSVNSTNPQTSITPQNYLINGNFSVWQRDQIGKNSSYTSTGSTPFADLWKRRDGITGSDTTKSYYLIRRSFDEYQSEVEGNPEYYIDVKAIGLSAAGISGISGGYTATDHYSIGHIIPGAKTFDKNQISVKFYGKCSDTGYSVDLYVNRYSGNQLLDYFSIGTIPLTTSWNQYSATAYIPALDNTGIDIDLDNDYVEIGVDLIRAIELQNINGITLGQDVFYSLASFSCSIGQNIPASVYPEYNTQLNYCQQFYYTSYDYNQNIGSVTLSDQTTPTQNTHSIFIQPNKSCNLLKWPIKMRTTPTVSFYSPASGLISRVYNKTASTSTSLLDTIQTSGTIGYDGNFRDGRNATITGSPTQIGVDVCITNGIVNYDEVYFHVVSDADFTI